MALARDMRWRWRGICDGAGAGYAMARHRLTLVYQRRIKLFTSLSLFMTNE